MRALSHGAFRSMLRVDTLSENIYMATAAKIVLWIVGGVLLVGVLVIGSCSALLWNTVNDTEAGAQRDAVRARHAALGTRLAQTAGGAADLLDAATRLRTVTLPPEVLGLSIARSDDDDNRISILCNIEGRQTSRFVVNGAGTITLTGADGARRTFDVLETQAALQDATQADIELVLAADATGDGPER